MPPVAGRQVVGRRQRKVTKEEVQKEKDERRPQRKPAMAPPPIS